MHPLLGLDLSIVEGKGRRGEMESTKSPIVAESASDTRHNGRGRLLQVGRSSGHLNLGASLSPTSTAATQQAGIRHFPDAKFDYSLNARWWPRGSHAHSDELPRKRQGTYGEAARREAPMIDRLLPRRESEIPPSLTLLPRWSGSCSGAWPGRRRC